LNNIFVSDCEGPISKNDNAFEIAKNFIPNGDQLFANISKYDDVMADVLEKPGYSAGGTLRLILPFFKAYCLSDPEMEAFSEQNIVLIANSRTMLQYVQEISDTFIVSTSYEHYIKALCKVVDFPFKNTYCTHVSLDKIPIAQQEKDRLRTLTQEITQMHQIDIPKDAKTTEDFCKRDIATIQRLDEIFWSEIPRMSVGKFLNVVTVGGAQKAESIRDAAKRLDVGLANVIYVGDSITDVQALMLMRENGGLSVSFNGNFYAVKNAEVAVQSESNLVLAVIADLFYRLGKEQTLNVLDFWSIETLEQSDVKEALLEQFFKVYRDCLPKVQIVTAEIMETITKESTAFRKKVRGVSTGRLG